jgi:glycerol-3-phosphate dehydrogenase
MTRQIPEDIGTYPFDLIVVGAGINGAGIARDAAMRGLRVLLLDKGDISDGTTQWSTRLIHGGLRYLEYYEVHLVRESLGEREKLLRIAPHLVRPLKFVVPIYERSKRGPGLIRLGMIGYDVLSFDKSVPNHKMLSRDEALEQYPGLNPDGLLGAATYYDGQVEYAERIAVENAISAREHGAVVITHAEVTQLLFEEMDGDMPRVVGVEFKDRLGQGTYTARAPVTVNVAGPWVDRVLSGSGAFGFEDGNGSSGGEDVSESEAEEGRMIGPTKGSHLVVDPFPGAPQDALYVEARKDGRPYFIVPWNGRYLIGTTDLRYEDDLDYVSAEEDEIEYLIDETNAVIPQAGLTRESVLFTYSGVRPLPYKSEGSESSITRAHVVYDHAQGKSAAGGSIKVAGGGPLAKGLISIVGGKLTTYRNLGRQTVNEVFKKLRRHAPPSRTAAVPLPGGATEDFKTFAANFKATGGVSEEVAERLLRIYGVRAPDVLAEAGDDSQLKLSLTPNPTVETGVIGAEILYAFRHELAETLADVLLRRTMVGLGPRVGLDVDRAAANLAAEHLGWDRDRVGREVQAYREYVTRYKPKQLQQGEPANA